MTFSSETKIMKIIHSAEDEAAEDDDSVVVVVFDVVKLVKLKGSICR